MEEKNSEKKERKMRDSVDWGSAGGVGTSSIKVFVVK